MMNQTIRILVFAFTMMASSCPISSWAQDDIMRQSDGYVWPKEKDVQNKLSQWQDLKFGVILHWGIYSVPGIVESWSICDENWITRDTTMTYQQYTDWYNSLADQFCPTQFDAGQWARVCRDAGMRYMVFTTKHHDGFCLWDSRETDFSIAKHAFRNDSRRDALRFVFDAFRKEQFMIGAYFSKPDWHSQYYWWDVYAKKGRNVNYPVDKFPWRWSQFRQFTHRQLQEILSGYGPIDILWLDGGWVYPENKGQDIDMPAVAAMGRRYQPGLLIVDRTIQGPYENYQTPEQAIPDHQILHPWESCITLSNDWGYVRNPRWKSSQQVIAKLVEIVAKGGNLLLGVGPTPEGVIQQEAVERLQEIGQWMRENGKAIYETVTTPDYHDGDVWFTKSKDGRSLFAIYVPADGASPVTTITWKGNIPAKGQKIRLVATGKTLRHTLVDGHVEVRLPSEVVGAVALEIR
jgi:alpha-L-fucosidase